MTEIDYYFITLSPFAYLAGNGLEDIAAKHNATINYKPMNLMAVFDETGGVAPPKRHPSRQAYRLKDLARVAEFNNMPINVTPAHWPTNPVPSCSAVIAAQNAGGGNLGGLVQGLLKSIWAEEKDIAQDEVIRAALIENGFDAALADKGLLEGAETFQRNTEEAIALGVFGAPSYVVNGEIFWGQDRLPHLDAFLAAQ